MESPWDAKILKGIKKTVYNAFLADRLAERDDIWHDDFGELWS